MWNLLVSWLTGWLIEARPGAGKPEACKPDEGKLVVGKIVEGKPVEGKPVEGKPVEGKPVEGKPVEGKPVEGKTVVSLSPEIAMLLWSRFVGDLACKPCFISFHSPSKEVFIDWPFFAKMIPLSVSAGCSNWCTILSLDCLSWLPMLLFFYISDQRCTWVSGSCCCMSSLIGKCLSRELLLTKVYPSPLTRLDIFLCWTIFE